MTDVTERRQGFRPAGMPCPQCNQAIIIDPLVLLSSTPIECAACGLELRVNMAQSSETLAALQAYMNDFAKIERDYARQVDDVSGGGPRKRTRRRRGEADASPRRRRRKAQ